jgi:hypothetical protein
MNQQAGIAAVEAFIEAFNAQDGHWGISFRSSCLRTPTPSQPG